MGFLIFLSAKIEIISMNAILILKKIMQHYRKIFMNYKENIYL
jgi:hypothetical protein